MPPLDHPGVRFPPPLLFVLGFVLGLLVQRVWPLAFIPGGRTPFSTLVAWMLVVLGGALLAWAIWTFRAAQTSVYPNRPATQIVERGPYRFSRNPMYVALSLMYLGLALWRNMLWPVLFLPLVLVLLWVLVIRREARYLTEAFGEAYGAYRQRVRRWV